MTRTCTRRAAVAMLAAGAFAWPATAESVGPLVRPHDGAVRDAHLNRVRAATIAAVKAKDWTKLAPHVDTKILIAFGGENGAVAFAKLLHENPVLWDELDWVLSHGGRFIEGEFWAPYMFQADVGKIDPYEAGIIVAAKVAARAEPRADAQLVATLDHHAVRVTDWRESDKTPRPFYNRKDWVKIELPGKRAAWVEARFVRSMSDYRAGFAKKRGDWKLTGFVHGD